MLPSDPCDVLISGGGMVGASLACALARPGLGLALVEASVPQTDAGAVSDTRVIALSEGSRRILCSIGLWPEVEAFTTPIKTIHVSQRGHFGATRLHAKDAGVAALGYVIPAFHLVQALNRKVLADPHIEVMAPARIVGYQAQDDLLLATVKDAGKEVQQAARLLVAADGGRSMLREAAGIGTREWGYRQAAVVTWVETEQPHDHVAYERFTDTGPMALLPMQGQRSALVWTVSLGQEQELLDLDDVTFLNRLGERFGERLGRFVACGARSAFPLNLVRSRAQYSERLAVIGNAAHTLHPVAGQGLNLGLRDVAALSEVLVDTCQSGGDPGAREVLQRYAQWRSADQRNVSAFSDALVRVFSNRFAPLSLLRSLGLTVLDVLPHSKRLLVRQAMGLGGRQPRLGRGLSL